MTITAGTKILSDYVNSSISTSYKTSNVNSSNKTSSTGFKDALNSKLNSNSKDPEETKDNSTKEVKSNENYKSSENDKSINNQLDDKDAAEIQKVKDKLEKLEEDSKSDSNDKVNEILTELMNLLNQLGVNQKNLMTDGNSSNNSSSVIDTLAKLLQTDSIKDKLDNSSLESIENILGNLSDDSKEIRNNMKDLMSELSNIINDKQNGDGKVVTPKDLLNRNYSQENQESQTENESNNSNTPLGNKETSKDDKFLNSLIDNDNGSTTDKINLFVSRNELIQNQGVADVSKNMTINKSTFVQDLVQDVKYMNNNGLKELTVKINPDNLGEITISLTQEEGTIKATLKATSKDTENLLVQNLSEIKSQLSDKNIKIDNVNIELYQEDTTFFKNGNFDGQSAKEQQNSRRTSNNNINEVVSTEDNLTEGTQVINDGNINFLA